MDLASALEELPEVHAAVLRLHHAGTDAAGIAAELGIDIDAVGPLLRVAKAKLTRLLAAPDTSGEGETRHTGRSSDAGRNPDS
jgi:DNA-directed RNA polymerase specialized sigma24 family protein